MKTENSQILRQQELSEKQNSPVESNDTVKLLLKEICKPCGGRSWAVNTTQYNV